MKIYLDLVVILNFLVDFLLLLGTNRLSGFPASPLRAAAAAALGAVYSGVCMMPRMRFLGGLLWRIVSLAGMAVIAFGWDKSAWKRSGVFVLLSMALGGASLSIGHGNFLTLLLTAGGVWALCIVAFGGRVLDKSEPKYMNTPETIAYSKRRVLYGMNLAKKSKRPNIILCEGSARL